MLFPKEFVERIKERVLPSEIIRRKVVLKSKGGNEHTGLCPFHSEKSPSFTVSDDKGFFHCFGCGAHGNIFDFLMRTEGLSFPDAIERLAVEAGLDLPKPDENQRRKDESDSKLMKCAEAACLWFQNNLKLSIGSVARDYIVTRGISPQVVEEFRLGFSPEDRGSLLKHMQSQNFKLQDLEKIGLIKNGYEYFRGRLIFPITNTKGEVIAFGGRILGPGEPKYLNSPETEIFHKRRTIYGRAIARKPAFEKGELIVVEGYMDTIALNQAGFKHTVAPLGTALTEDHLAAMWKMCKEPSLCFDGDNAGKNAAIRAANMAIPFLQAGYSLKFVQMPEKQDPDDVVRKDPNLFKALLKAAKPLSEVIYESEFNKGPVKTPEQQSDLRTRLTKIVSLIKDKDVSRNYANFLDKKLWSTIKLVSTTNKAPVPIYVPKTVNTPAESERKQDLELGILGVLYTAPGLLENSSIEEVLVNLEFSALEIDKLRQNILYSIAAGDDDIAISINKLIAGVNEKYKKAILRGAEFAKKHPNPMDAWKNILEQYHQHLMSSEHDEMAIDSEEEFYMLQQRHNQLLESREKINASQAD